MKKIILVATIGLMVTLLCSCDNKKDQTKKGTRVIKKEDMDLSVKPGVNFFEYANGTWLKNTPIPDDKSRYGSFDILAENANKAIHLILKKATETKTTPKGSNLQKIKDFYTTAMDVDKINKVGISPLLPEFKKIDAIKNSTDLRNELVHLHKIGVGALFGISVEQDMKKSDTYRMYLSESGLSLSDRDYYTEDDANAKNIRKEFIKYLTKMLEFMGQNKTSAKRDAIKIMKFETRMAQKFNTHLENRNDPALYNPKTIKTLIKEYPNFDWARYFKQMGANIKEYVIVQQPKYIAELNKILGEKNLANIKLYLKWKVLNNAASRVNTELEKESFAFYGTVMTGTTKQRPRWKRMVDATSSVLGEAVGQLYVKKYFPPKAKQRMLKLVNNLKITLHKRIKKLDWMSQETKKAALEKLSALGLKIGYPDKWKDYSKLEVGTDSFIQNQWRAAQFYSQRNIAKLGKPIDKTEWGMTPQTVNAYYNPSMNEIVFPAAILQPPFFYINGDAAVNYGAIGVVIGHEMTHGFDDSGRRFDKNGNLKNWWKAKDTIKFNAKVKNLINQFNGFKVLDNLHVNGKLTLGENLADYGGLTISLDAYKKVLNGKKIPNIDGFTNMQRFFLSYAKVWRGNIRDKLLTKLIKEDVHSPAKFRVNGALFNIPEFYTTFEIKKTDPLYRTKEQRIKIW